MAEPDLRDVFACCALVGLANQSVSALKKAEMAYEIADHMLVVRKEEEEGIVAIKRKEK